MPQFDVSTYMPQIFWVLVIFFCYWLLMDKFLIPKIAEMVEARKRKYNDFILKAEEINKKAQESLAQYENTLSAARAEANAQIAKNEADLKELITQKETELKKELSAKMAEHEERLAAERKNILKKIDELSAKTAYIAVQQLDLPVITRKDIDELVKRGESL
jgi:F-type H+-transporting ATPase subunit b